MKKFGFVYSFIPLAVAITLLSLMTYGVAQQSIRIGSYNPQIQMAEDAAADVAHGIKPETVIPTKTIDVSASLAPFMIVYDDRGTVLASNVVLNGKVPQIPPGVLDFAREKRQDRLTWQPAPDVRAAVVVARYVGNKPGFVLAGRSIREVENLTEKLFFDVAVGWAVAMAATFVAAWIFRR